MFNKKRVKGAIEHRMERYEKLKDEQMLARAKEDVAASVEEGDEDYEIIDEIFEEEEPEKFAEAQRLATKFINNFDFEV